jgi:exodeoxyribonuclease III
MKVATWNVNSIRARLPRVLAWLAEQRPDVACLQETKVEDSAFPEADLRALGYEIALFGQRTYNGVALLSRTPLADVARGFDDGARDEQARFIVARTAGLRIASLYVPNGQSVGSDKFQYKLEWLRRLRAWLDVRCQGSEPLLLCGDYNVAPDDRDVHDPELWRDQVLCHPLERERLAEVSAFGLADLFRQKHAEPGFYSWWDYRQLAFPKNRGLRIDHILATAPAAARCQSVVIDRAARKGKEPSDHAPVVATFAD